MKELLNRAKPTEAHRQQNPEPCPPSAVKSHTPGPRGQSVSALTQGPDVHGMMASADSKRFHALYNFYMQDPSQFHNALYPKRTGTAPHAPALAETP